jgi:hypothetical protein
MLDTQQPFERGYACVQQGSYEGKQCFKVNRALWNFQQLPTDKFQVYHGISAEQVQGWQPTRLSRNQMGVFSCESKSNITNSVSEGSTSDGCKYSKSVLCHNYPKIKQEVSAFGPKHAEHARRFYQAAGLQPKLSRDLDPPYLPSYCPMQVSYIKRTQASRECDLLGGSVFDRTLNRTTSADPVSLQVPFPVTFQREVKVAKISPRPNIQELNNPKIYLGVNERILSYKMAQGTVMKLIDTQNVDEEMDLSKAPLFQILCEISKE